jgi:adenylate cyclase
VARGFVNALHDVPVETVVQDFHRAAMLSPNLPEVHWRLGSSYLYAGLFDEALSELNKVLALDPHNYRARYYVARVHHYQQRYDEALLDYERSPDFRPGNLWEKVLVLFHHGEKAAAHELLGELRRKLSDNADMASTDAVLLAAEGKNPQAEEQIRLAVRIGGPPGHFYIAEYNIGSAYALMGNHQEALRWLRTAAKHRFPCYPLFERDPNLNNLRDDPEFKAWLREIKSLWEHNRSSLQ